MSADLETEPQFLRRMATIAHPEHFPDIARLVEIAVRYRQIAITSDAARKA